MPAKLFGLDFRRSPDQQLHQPHPPPPPQQQQQQPPPPSPSPPAPSTDRITNGPFTTEHVRVPTMDALKRPGLVLGKRHSSTDKKNRSRSKDDDAPRDRSARDIPRSPLHPGPVTLNLRMESPPALFINAPQQSSGALISGRLQVHPTAQDVVLDSIAMYLEATTTIRRPVADRCRECAHTVNDLYEWKFLSKPKTFTVAAGLQDLPFSHLIPGHLPCTTHGELGSIDYSLHVRARTAAGQEAEFRRELVIARALPPGTDKDSVRIFPPTNLSLHVSLPSQVHPIGDFPISCRMSGIVTRNADTHTRWRLRKLTWRIEEVEEMISPACVKHAAKVGGEGKGIKHEHKRDIGWAELKTGWKSDFDDGVIEGEFLAAIDGATRPQYDVEAANGLRIAHHLVLELVIAEEWAPNRRPQQATPTGAARVLRTQFKLHVTARAGMGLAWDDEQPPRYEDVPDSPPHYIHQHTSIDVYDGDMESLTLN